MSEKYINWARFLLLKTANQDQMTKAIFLFTMAMVYYTNKHNTIDETIIISRIRAYCCFVFSKNKPLWISDKAMFTNSKEIISSKCQCYLLKEKI